MNGYEYQIASFGLKSEIDYITVNKNKRHYDIKKSN